MLNKKKYFKRKRADYLLLLLLVLLSVGEDLGQQGIKVGVRPQRSSRDEFFPACWTLFVS